MKNKKVILLVGIVLFCNFLMAVYLIFGRSSQVPENEKVTEVKALSIQENRRVSAKYRALLQTSDPTVAIRAYEEATKKQPLLLDSCHAVLHELGRDSYAKYANYAEAMRFRTDFCTSGYIHGVTEAYIQDAGDINEAIQIACINEVPGGPFRWQCNHGIGHGLMFLSNNNLPYAIEKCQNNLNVQDRHSCINGVFMENFNSDQETHPSIYLKDDDPLFPCNEQKPEYMAECYYTAPHFILKKVKNNYRKALDVCYRVEGKNRLECISGVIGIAMLKNLSSTNFVESLCTREGAEQKACINGILGGYISHYGSLDKAEVLCKSFKPNNEQLCYLYLSENSKLL